MKDCCLRPDACGEDITMTDRNEWKLKAELFLAEELSEQKKKDAAAANKKKWYRVATSDLAWGTERRFQVMLGHGMIALATKGEGVVVPEHILDRQRVTISWDMGPDNLCFTSYLLFKKEYRVSVFFSPLHKVQRCMWGGVGKGGRYSTVLVGNVVVNSCRGPFNGESDWQVIKGSTLELQQMIVAGDPLLRILVPNSCREVGGDPLTVDDEYETKWVVDLTDEPWYKTKPPKVAINHWNTWNDAFEGDAY